jgi:chromosome partitioning protein
VDRAGHSIGHLGNQTTYAVRCGDDPRKKDRVIKLVVCNQKGGVAKTTTTHTLAHFMARKGKKVLVFDTDQQGNLADALGVKAPHDLHEFIIEGLSLEETRYRVYEKPEEHTGLIDMVCSTRRTVETEAHLMGRMGREFTLKNILDPMDLSYDVVIFDTAPSFSLLQTCSIIYAPNLLIPVAMDLLALQGASAAVGTAQQVNQIFNTNIKALAFLPVMVEKQLQMTKLVRSNLERLARTLEVEILPETRKDATVSKCMKNRQFLADYAPQSRIVEDYDAAFARLLEILEGAPHEQAVNVTTAA